MSRNNETYSLSPPKRFTDALRKYLHWQNFAVGKISYICHIPDKIVAKSEFNDEF